ncbi:FcoT family thioesterase [Streptomyces yangpuensis]|uniref:FcoT family thioesterase n=1 Tax=Streptomyces yangpuensis TaxID=1648182 RepID=UPI00371EFE30
MTQTRTPPAGSRPDRLDTDTELLARVLRPYREHCQYLKSCEVTGGTGDGDGGADGPLTARCTFEIPESCYIDDTGHFNSVEFNICYNQMLYYVIAKSVQDGLLESFAHWSMEDYWQRQLADFLITDFRSTFKRAMRGRHFSGEIQILDVVEWEGSDIREPLLVVHTACRYWDASGGNCHGEVKIAITHPTTAVQS